MATEPHKESMLRASLTVLAGVAVLVVGGVTVAVLALREGAQVRGPASFLVDPPRVDVTPGTSPDASAPPPDDWTGAGTPRAEPAPPAAPSPRRQEGAREVLPLAPAGGPVDKRPGPHPGGAALAQALQASLEQMEPDVQDCVRQWADAGLVFDGGLMVSVRLGPAGLQDAGVLDVTDLPGPLLTCFAAAVRAVDWPAVEEPVELTRRYEIASDDSG